MFKSKCFGMIIAGFCAGVVNGLFGAGGGMVLVPLLCIFTDLEHDQVFPASVSIILPICLVSLSFAIYHAGFQLDLIFPYLIGGTIGGTLAGLIGKRIPVVWLHRILGIMILWGGIRYLC